MSVEPPLFAAHYQRPDLDAVAATAAQLAKAVAAADRERALAALAAWNQLRIQLDTQHQIAEVGYARDTRSESAQMEKAFWDGATPWSRKLDVSYARALLASPHRAAIDGQYGAQLAALAGCVASTFVPAIESALADEARLGTRYTELLARDEVEFCGRRYNLSSIAGLFGDADRDTRLGAQQSRERFLSRHGAELDHIFHQLVDLRDGMAHELGFETFTPLGYKLLQRSEYGPGRVSRFREQILREVVPLAGELHARQSQRLGVDKVLYHDEPVYDLSGNPRPVGGPDELVTVAHDMYRELGQPFGEFFALLRDNGLLDVEGREGKAGGGFCATFADQGLPFVFANFNGSDGDVRVLTHECGHAFQCYRSRHHPLLEYRFPTYEACEIHSMGMEYLTYPWMGRFFGDEEGERFRRMHLEQSLLALPYMAAVDHFQHEVCARPTMTPAERHAAWRELERLYLPDRDFGGLFPSFEAGGSWQRQLHIFRLPFYYIDYALAQTCALQLWTRSLTDRDATVRDYLAICEVGGSLSFEGIVALGNLRSPFEPGCLSAAVDAAARQLLG